MRRSWLAVGALLSACGGNVRSLELATIVFTDVVRISCADGGVACEQAPRPIGAPMCGFGFNSLTDAGTVTLDLAQPPDTVQGLYQVDALFQPAQGDAVELGSLRGLVTVNTSTLYSMVDRSPAFAFSTSGQIGLLPGDGGLPLPGNRLSMEKPLDDGGVLLVTETVTVASTARRTVAVRDHTGDPFYGCCAHVDATAPMLALAFLAAPLLGRRRLTRRR